MLTGMYLCSVCDCEAKRQRTIQVMDIHEIPKPKNSFIAKNKGGGGSGSHQGRHWWLIVWKMCRSLTESHIHITKARGILGVTPRKRSETSWSFLLHFFLLSKTRGKKKDHFCSYFFFLLNKKHKIFSVLWNPTVPSYFPFLWLALSGFDEAMVPKENTIFFPSAF